MQINNKKISTKYIKLLRHLTQLVSFFLLPGFFILILGEMKFIFQSLVNGNMTLLKLLPVSIELIFTFLFSIVFGRFFCGWICAFGTFNDFIYNISKTFFKTSFKINPKLDYALKYLKYLILGLIMTLSWMLGYSLFESASPWGAFAVLTDLHLLFSSYLVGLFILLAITAGALFIERFFCRYLCPLGAVFALLSKLSIFNIDKPKDECGVNRSGCRVCTRSCSMGLSLYSKNDIRGGDCINCLSCIEACPSKNAKAALVTVRIPAAMAICIGLIAIIGLYTLSNAVATDASATNGKPQYESNLDYKEPSASTIPNLNNNTINKQTEISNETSSSGSYNKSITNSNTKVTKETDSSQQNTNTTASAENNKASTSANNNTSPPTPTPKSTKYKDGTYTGSGIGFRNGITTVSVTIRNDRIANIETVSSEDTPRFYLRVESTLFEEIIASQSSSIDTISGATYSSYGILDGVQDALNKAVKANSN